jgi:putative membrane protein
MWPEYFVDGVKALPRAQKVMLALLLIAVGLANIAQPYPELAPLQHIPTVVLVLAAPMLLRRWPMSTASVASLWMFWLLHTLGGRYIYSYVPYDDWARALTGGTVSAVFGWPRNEYDRLVHLCFGLLWTLPITEGLRRRHGIGAGLALFIAFAVIGLCSALYEIFEWALTLFAAGDTADYYNGQQGDLWDAQKDMACAQLGSAVAIIWAKARAR